MRGFLTGVALTLVTACAGVMPRLEPPSVTLSGVALQEFGLVEQRYRLRLRIQNPNAVELTSSGMVFSLDLNGVDFAHGTSATIPPIPPFGERLVDIPVTGTLVGILRQLKMLGGEGVERITYGLTGKIVLTRPAVELPFDYRGSIDLAPADVLP
jgi:LEA14-like dessication related protein